MAIINKAKFWMTTEAGSKDARKRYVRYVLSPYCEEWNDARINQSGFWNVVHVKEEVHNLSEFTRLSCRFLRGIDGYTRVDAVMSREEKIFYEAGRRLIRDILENIDKTHMGPFRADNTIAFEDILEESCLYVFRNLKSEMRQPYLGMIETIWERVEPSINNLLRRICNDKYIPSLYLEMKRDGRTN